MLDRTLQQGLQQLGLSLSAAQQQLLLRYMNTLIKWNKAYNLVGTDREDVLLTHHLLDSLSVIPFVQVKTVLDIGSGAGLPGIPLAIALPTTEFTLIDSNGKKTRFLNHIKHELGLSNLQVVNSRVEKFNTEQSFDVIISRAVGSVAMLKELSQHLSSASTQLMLMKGLLPQHELESIDHQIRIEKLDVPGVEGQRHLVIIGGQE